MTWPRLYGYVAEESPPIEHLPFSQATTAIANGKVATAVGGLGEVDDRLVIDIVVK